MKGHCTRKWKEKTERERKKKKNTKISDVISMIQKINHPSSLEIEHA